MADTQPKLRLGAPLDPVPLDRRRGAGRAPMGSWDRIRLGAMLVLSGLGSVGALGVGLVWGLKLGLGVFAAGTLLLAVLLLF